MSISDTISSVAAANPAAGVAVTQQSVGSAILAGLQTGDQATAPLLGALGGQVQEVSRLLASLQPNLGQNVSTSA